MKKITALLAALVLAVCLSLPALAVDLPFDTSGSSWIYDPQGLIGQEDLTALEQQLSDTAMGYDCGIYVLLLQDFTVYGYSDIFEFAQDVYEDASLGVGDTADGVLLAVSTQTRDVSIAIHGDRANAAFTDYGREEVLYSAFLDDFSAGDWAAGAAHFADACADLLYAAIHDAPVDVPPEEPVSFGDVLGGNLLVCFIPAAIIAFIACTVMKKNMKTARKAVQAEAYMAGSVDLTVREDHYSHSTVLRTPIERKSAPPSGGSHGSYHGGTTVNSRGFSGSSRKF